MCIMGKVEMFTVGLEERTAQERCTLEMLLAFYFFRKA
jgi:hypothetical protein